MFKWPQLENQASYNEFLRKNIVVINLTNVYTKLHYIENSLKHEFFQTAIEISLKVCAVPRLNNSCTYLISGNILHYNVSHFFKLSYFSSVNVFGCLLFIISKFFSCFCHI